MVVIHVARLALYVVAQTDQFRGLTGIIETAQQLECDLTAAESRITILQRKLARERETNAGLLEYQSTLECENERARIEKDEHHEVRLQLTAQHTAAVELHARTSKEAAEKQAALEAAITELEAKVSAQEATMQELNKSLENSKSSATTHETHEHQLEQQIAKLAADTTEREKHETALATELATEKASVSKHEQHEHQLETKLAAEHAKHETHEAELVAELEITKVSAANHEAQEQLLLNQANQLAGLTAQLGEALEGSKLAVIAKDEFEASLTKVTAEVRERESALVELQAAHDALKASAEENSKAMNTTIVELKGALDTQRKTGTQEEKANRITHEANQKALKGEVSELQAKLQVSRRALEKEKDDTEVVMASRNKEIELLKKEIAQLKRDLEEAYKTLEGERQMFSEVDVERVKSADSVKETLSKVKMQHEADLALHTSEINKARWQEAAHMVTQFKMHETEKEALLSVLTEHQRNEVDVEQALTLTQSDLVSNIKQKAQLWEKADSLEFAFQQTMDQFFNPVWVADETVLKCIECGVGFTLFKRKHHCRICGNIYCRDCTNYHNDFGAQRQRMCRTCNANVEVIKHSKTPVELIKNTRASTDALSIAGT